MILTNHELVRLDGTVRAAQLLRFSAKGYARDNCNGRADELDPLGYKLDAYSLGLLDGMHMSAKATGRDESTLRLLVYLLMLCDEGPGKETVNTVERMLANVSGKDVECYVEMGRLDILRLLAGDQTGSESYANLLLAEHASHKLVFPT